MSMITYGYVLCLYIQSAPKLESFECHHDAMSRKFHETLFHAQNYFQVYSMCMKHK
jgi:hypothetical protein